MIPAGLEPATYCLEGSCSIQLSYETPNYGRHPNAIPMASFGWPYCISPYKTNKNSNLGLPKEATKAGL